MKHFAALCLALLLLAASSSHAQEMRVYDVVAEYIRELAALENVRDLALKEVGGDNNAMMASAIRNSTRVNLELGTSIRALGKMKLKKRLRLHQRPKTGCGLRQICCKNARNHSEP